MEKELSRSEINAKLAQKAKDSPEFHKLLLENPKQAIKETFKIDVPDFINLHVIEEKGNDFYILLPSDQESLTPEMLDLISGGFCITGMSWGPTSTCQSSCSNWHNIIL